MFDSLSDKIHQDEAHEESPMRRMTRYVVIALAAVAVIVVLAEVSHLVG